MSVPVSDPLRLDPDERSAVEEAVDRVLRNGPLVLGPAVEAFEERFGAYVGGAGAAPYVVGVGNGSDALVLSLLALDLPSGAGVLVPANDGGFAAGAARAAGFVPVPVDVDPASLLVSPDTAHAALSPSCAALVVTHLHGNVAELAALDAWRRSHGLRLIEDCAQAHGARSDQGHVGTTGDLATFSFYPTKNLGAMGDAGAVVTRDPDLASAVRRLARYGWGERFRITEPAGRNSRLDALQAAVLVARLPFLDAANQRRRAVVAAYADAAPDLVLPMSAGGVAHHAIVLTAERDAVRARLAADGVATDVHYPWLVTEMPGLGLDDTLLPGADVSRRRTLTLPCFPGMTEPEVATVVGALSRAEDGVRA
ncbi:MAG: DegT/DnrJ/EryC1/StrS family aminotransferase [Nocardioidaceae bacterium]|nr:DegT/DnrJ/EryC1/StrS family aminotransferase [Nocardioidaceae bacterium]